MKPYHGEIHHWTIEQRGASWVVIGTQKPNDYIRTSTIVLLNLETGYVETKNSLYNLGEPR